MQAVSPPPPTYPSQRPQAAGSLPTISSLYLIQLPSRPPQGRGGRRRLQPAPRRNERGPPNEPSPTPRSTCATYSPTHAAHSNPHARPTIADLLSFIAASHALFQRGKCRKPLRQEHVRDRSRTQPRIDAAPARPKDGCSSTGRGPCAASISTMHRISHQSGSIPTAESRIQDAKLTPIPRRRLRITTPYEQNRGNGPALIPGCAFWTAPRGPPSRG